MVAASLLKELNAEIPSTQKCLERITENLWEFKPHPKSMAMGYLVLLVAEIPLWIATMIEESEIDFARFKHAQLKNTTELVNHFQENVKKAKQALEHASEESIAKMFYLKSSGKELYKAPNHEFLESTLNHWVHHRGQLTVYMRMCEVPVPSIYGPSADDQNY